MAVTDGQLARTGWHVMLGHIDALFLACDNARNRKPGGQPRPQPKQHSISSIETETVQPHRTVASLGASGMRGVASGASIVHRMHDYAK